MNNGESTTILLMTATVNPNSSDILAVKDPEVRKGHYLDAISYYLEKTNYKIVFTENSGTSLKPHFVNQNRIEFLTYVSPFTVPERSKGWKELEIIDYSIKNSFFIQSASAVLKVTGRLKLLNISEIEKQEKYLRPFKTSYVLCNIFKAYKMDSRCFLFTLDFWPILHKNGQEIDVNYSFERALWKAICEYDIFLNGHYKQFNRPSRIEGISGGLGISYQQGILLTVIKIVRHVFMVPLIYNRLRNQNSQ